MTISQKQTKSQVNNFQNGDYQSYQSINNTNSSMQYGKGGGFFPNIRTKQQVNPNMQNNGSYSMFPPNAKQPTLGKVLQFPNLNDSLTGIDDGSPSVSNSFLQGGNSSSQLQVNGPNNHYQFSLQAVGQSLTTGGNPGEYKSSIHKKKLVTEGNLKSF
eukprot:CAMPEP_0170551838 /NCGR_PEP_ID=MMETSP0211-20121228/9838_1 /TAXON_ID=311385 /ORGANISM="Pseudokeronopsis sp., Strain OXSARD2" /LENGTH=157 /DNA_ID=CAMNT_0010859257 /DNA_START=625 /DNA_END=1101 /DNA_ORIENTATION=+